MSDKKKDTWIKPRHKIATCIVRFLLSLYLRILYGRKAKFELFKEEGNRQYLILANHQTRNDQFFISQSFRNPVYYVATEDIFSLGFKSRIMEYLVAPIPIRKQNIDFTAVKTCFQVVKEGGNIAMMPEGNCTYSGKTEYINPAVVKMAKKFRLPIALYRIEGGYGAHPRWSGKIRKGPVRARVSRVLEVCEYEKMTNEELCQLINEELYVNEAIVDYEYKSKHLAEYLEKLVYICPFCGLSTFESHGDIVECKKCNRQIRYKADKTMEGIGFEFPFRFVNDWYHYQEDFINQLDLGAYQKTPIYEDTVTLMEVILYKKKIKLQDNAKVLLYGDRIEVGELVFSFENVQVTAIGTYKVNIYSGDKIYQLKGHDRFNLVKYIHLFYRYNNMNRKVKEGEENGQFLGF